MLEVCRCSVAAWEDSEDYDAWLDYLSKGGTTEEWNRLQILDNSSTLAYNRFRNKFKAVPAKNYTEPMTKKHVRSVMKEMGIDYGKP